ncbi:MAG: NTP transferase domain-containing protein, partial [Polyangiales bacterium]
MRVISIAASRLRPFSTNTPNCLQEVGGRTILSRAIGALVAQGLRRFTIVDGFMGDYLRADVLAEFPPEWFDFVRNAEHATSGDAHSLLLARPETPEPLFLLDCDLVFDRRLVARMLAGGRHDRRAQSAGKPLGLATLSTETATELFEVLHRRVHDDQGQPQGYDAALRELSDRGRALDPVGIDDLACVKVESSADLAFARRLFASPSG